MGERIRRGRGGAGAGSGVSGRENECEAPLAYAFNVCFRVVGSVSHGRLRSSSMRWIEGRMCVLHSPLLHQSSFS
jgi:hypothetical protein